MAEASPLSLFVQRRLSLNLQLQRRPHLYAVLFVILAALTEPQSHLERKSARLIILHQVPGFFQNDQFLRIQRLLQPVSNLNR